MRKKKIIAIVLAVVVVAAVLGGFAYATSNSHESLVGQKLVGTSQFGSVDYPDGCVTYEVLFTFTNPDCVGEITVDGVRIIKGDGTIIYQGLFRQQTIEDDNVVGSTELTEMKAHEVWSINLAYYMPDGNGGWLSGSDARDLSLVPYTVEIFWTGHKEVCPLAGYILVKRLWDYENANPALARDQMVNMEQELKPKDEY